MKRSWITPAVTMLALAILLLSQGGSGVAAQEPGATGVLPAHVTVTGTGTAMLEPDRSAVRLGVETQAETAGAAIEQNGTQMEAVLQALRDAGVADEDIQTQTLQLFPIYTEPTPAPTPLPSGVLPGPTIAGYRASNVVRVTTMDIDNIGALIDAAITAGANTVQDIQFEVSDPTAAMTTAREDALADAQAKAEQLAELTGTTLGSVYSITEYGGPQPVFGIGGGVALETAQLATPVQPGQQLVTLSVTATWLLQVAP
jgi:uncharacterized protein YggE